MKKKCLFFFIFITSAIYSQNTINKKIETWVDIGYLQCFKEKLPCECSKWVRQQPAYLNYSLPFNDTNWFDRNKIINYQNNEKVSFDLINHMGLIDKDTLYIANIQIKNDTLLYFNLKDSVLYKYIPFNYQLNKIEDSLSGLTPY